MGSIAGDGSGICEASTDGSDTAGLVCLGAIGETLGAGGSSESEAGDDKSEVGCWIKFRLMGNCISARSKVDSSISSASTHCGNFLLAFLLAFIY